MLILKSLKADYKQLTGEDFIGGTIKKSKGGPAKQKPPKEKQKKKNTKETESDVASKVGGADSVHGLKKHTR